MNHTFDSHDREHLAELMHDFPVENPPSIDQASKLIHLRFDKLNPEQFTVALAPLSDTEFSKRMKSLPWKMHQYLFQGILSNAGLARSYIDPEKGSIYFGPRQQFKGFSPDRITNGVDMACSYLARHTNDPIGSVVNFYQLFVYVHPFYDANGRIGRFITNIYLNHHGLYLSWKRLHHNQKWLRKLNNCHKRFGQCNYDDYLQLVIEHWWKFILRREDIEPVE